MRLDELYSRDKGICHICKQPVPRVQASRDHLIPRSKLRKEFTIDERMALGESETNVALAHKKCNSRRGSTEIEDIQLSDFTRSHLNPAWYFLMARKGFRYCKCPCMCKIQIPDTDPSTICDTLCQVHYISYV